MYNYYFFVLEIIGYTNIQHKFNQKLGQNINIFIIRTQVKNLQNIQKCINIFIICNVYTNIL